MNYLDEIATEIQRLVWGPLRTENEPAHYLPLYRIYAVLALAKGEDTTAEDVHNAWVAWTLSWNPSHPSAKPFSELIREVQELDLPYVRAIHAVARRRDA